MSKILVNHFYPPNNNTSISDVPEGILVDLGTSPDDGSKKVFDEAEVNDIAELRDLVEGYKSQNQFLNMEILGRIFF